MSTELGTSYAFSIFDCNKASPAGEILLVVATTKQNESLKLRMIEPDWYVVPGNVHTQKTLEHAIVKRCLKAFNVKTKEGLDHDVQYKGKTCTKNGHRDHLFQFTLAAPSKIFLEAFHEFSILWHDLKPKKNWTLLTDEEAKRYSVCSDSKTFLKPSRDKDYIISCDISQNTSDSNTGVCLAVFRKKDKQRILSLIGKQYNAETLEKISKDENEKSGIERSKI